MVIPVIQERLPPRTGLCALGVLAEVDVRLRSFRQYRLEVPRTSVSRVTKHFLHLEPLAGHFQQRREEWGVVVMGIGHDGSGDDAGAHAAHDVCPLPAPFAPLAASFPLGVILAT